MNNPLTRGFSIVAMIIASAVPAVAQFGPSGEQFARILDRDGDGLVDPDELDRLPDRVRNSLEENGVDLSRSISADDLADVMTQRFEAMRVEREAGDGDRGSWDRGRFGDFGGRSSTSTSEPSPAPMSRERVTVPLPDQFASADTDRDGQIGLYEWRTWKGRASLAEFRSHDRNGDGFLTPRELALGPLAPSVGPVQTALASGPAPMVISANAFAAVPTSSAVSSASNPSSGATSGGSNETVEAAKRFYGMLDKDRNGKVSMTEWEASRRIRGMFEADQLTLAEMTEGDFIGHYARLSAAAGDASSGGSRGEGGRRSFGGGRSGR